MLTRAQTLTSWAPSPLLLALALGACSGDDASETIDASDALAQDSGGADADADAAPLRDGDTRDADRSDAASDAADLGNDTDEEGPALIYVGERGGRVSVREIDRTSGALTERTAAERDGRLTYLAPAPEGDAIYAGLGRAIARFALGADDGALTFDRISEDVLPGDVTHLEVDTSGRWIVAASYGGGAAALIPILEDGALGDPVELGACEKAHQARFAPNNRAIHVPCLGDDAISTWSFDPATGVATPITPASTANGAGPRHLDYAPDGRTAYVVMESNSSIEVFDLDPSTGALTRTQTISSLPDGEAPSSASDIRASADGRFVWMVNRAPREEIVRFDVDPASGALSVGARTSSPGRGSRSIALVDGGKFLIAGHNKRAADDGEGGLLAVYAIDEEGALTLRSSEPTDQAVWYVGAPATAR